MKRFAFLFLFLGMGMSFSPFIYAQPCTVQELTEDVLIGIPNPSGGTGPSSRSLRGIINAYNNGLVCNPNDPNDKTIKFFAGATFNIKLKGPLDLRAAPGWIIDGAGATVTIDASDLAPNDCVFTLNTNDLIWKNMKIKVHQEDKAFCDNGMNNHHTDGDMGLDIEFLCGNARVDTGEQCDPSTNSCCNNTCDAFKPMGTACSLFPFSLFQNGLCSANHQCVRQILVIDTASFCGDGQVQGILGEQCDPLFDVCCDSTCHRLMPGQGNCTANPPPILPDTDQDGVPNITDNCPTVANGPILLGPNQDNQRDTDGDGLGDACEPVIGGPDRDGDQIPDSSDACPDSPGPGTVDGCPVGPQPPPPPVETDTDGDGTPDISDQCPTESGRHGSLPGCPAANEDRDGRIHADSCALTGGPSVASPFIYLLGLIPLGLRFLGRKKKI